jgi:aldose sugar dehydrogenase
VKTLLLACLALSVTGIGYGQRSLPLPRLEDGPWLFESSERNTRFLVSVFADDLVRPWSIAFLPSGEILVTERPGRLRVIRNGVLDPSPVGGIPEVLAQQLGGLLDIALHPDFANNALVYLTYSKAVDYGGTTALARGRWDGRRLVDTEDVFVAAAPGGDRVAGSRVIFAPDGTLFMTVGGAGAPNDRRAQDLGNDAGKILRLNEDGSIPPDNPFVGQEGARPEIYSYGHRNPLGLFIHPTTGTLWASEQGPQGGDEVNIIRPGRNYGWPLVTYGRDYDGLPVSDQPWRGDLEPPEIFWVPSIATTGGTFYTGDMFPAWQGDLFVGGMTEARIPQTGQIQRIVFNENGEIRREAFLREFRQRIRDIRQSPDGLLYVLTDEDDGLILRMEPAP